MSRVINKEELKGFANNTDKTYIEDMIIELLNCDHNIVLDDDNTLRWETIDEDDDDFNCTVKSLYKLGFNKNSEVFRNHYRKQGYSLFGYWEVFYWDVNNELCDEYEYGDYKYLIIDCKNILEQGGSYTVDCIPGFYGSDYDNKLFNTRKEAEAMLTIGQFVKKILCVQSRNITEIEPECDLVVCDRDIKNIEGVVIDTIE